MRIAFNTLAALFASNPNLSFEITPVNYAYPENHYLVTLNKGYHEKHFDYIVNLTNEEVVEINVSAGADSTIYTWIDKGLKKSVLAEYGGFGGMEGVKIVRFPEIIEKVEEIMGVNILDEFDDDFEETVKDAIANFAEAILKQINAKYPDEEDKTIATSEKEFCDGDCNENCKNCADEPVTVDAHVTDTVQVSFYDDEGESVAVVENNLVLTENVLVELEVDVLDSAFRMAHEQNLSFNDFVNNVLIVYMTAIRSETSEDE